MIFLLVKFVLHIPIQEHNHTVLQPYNSGNPFQMYIPVVIPSHFPLTYQYMEGESELSASPFYHRSKCNLYAYNRTILERQGSNLPFRYH